MLISTHREPGVEGGDGIDCMILRAHAAHELLLKLKCGAPLDLELQVLGSCQVGAHGCQRGMRHCHCSCDACCST